MYGFQDRYLFFKGICSYALKTCCSSALFLTIHLPLCISHLTHAALSLMYWRWYSFPHPCLLKLFDFIYIYKHLQILYTLNLSYWWLESCLIEMPSCVHANKMFCACLAGIRNDENLPHYFLVGSWFASTCGEHCKSESHSFSFSPPTKHTLTISLQTNSARSIYM